MRYLRFALVAGKTHVLPANLPEPPEGYRWLRPGESIGIGDSFWVLRLRTWHFVQRGDLESMLFYNRLQHWTVRKEKRPVENDLPYGVDYPAGYRPLYEGEFPEDDDLFYWTGRVRGWMSVEWCETKTPTLERVPRYRLNRGRVARKIT